MTDSVAGLHRKIVGARDLQGVVRTMRAVAAASIGQYENSVRALGDYYRTVEWGLSVCMRQRGSEAPDLVPGRSRRGPVGAVVFGSDQGLVGRFNDVICDFARDALADVDDVPRVWAVGERARTHLEDAGVPVAGEFPVPGSVSAIAELVGRVLLETEVPELQGELVELHLFYNRTHSGAQYEPVGQRLLPLDERWRRQLRDLPWPSTLLPEVVGSDIGTLRALIREYLFVSLFRACAESLASENTSRLAAMQRADRNIDELLEELNGTLHRVRQDSIDEELFDVIAGFEALSGKDSPA